LLFEPLDVPAEVITHHGSDLGASKPFDTIVFQWEKAYAKAYTIDVSENGMTWTTVYTQTNGIGGTEVIHLPLTIARYVRMSGVTRGTPFGYSLWEFQIYREANNP
jgi:hypothetical protein